MKARIALVLTGLSFSPAVADELPFGWDDCIASYATQGSTGCVRHVARDCAGTDTMQNCLEDHARDWLSYDVNTRLLRASETKDLKGLADAALSASAILREAAKRCDGAGAMCLLTDAIERALDYHAPDK